MSSRASKDSDDDDYAPSAKKAKLSSMVRNGRFYCDECGKSLATSYGLEAHIKTVHGKRHFECEFCDKAFARKDHLVNHTNSIHTGVKTCNICNQQFKGRDGLEDHKKMAHKPVYVPPPPKPQPKPQTLIKIANNTSQVMCKPCNKKFSNRQLLNDHFQAAHILIQCTLCEEAFVGSAKLEEHYKNVHKQIVQDVEVVYKCDYCSGTFKQGSSLNEHVQAFHAEMCCLICGSSFIGVENVLRHISETHPPKKVMFDTINLNGMVQPQQIMFQCEYCVDNIKTFRHRTDFDQHFRSAHVVQLNKSTEVAGSTADLHLDENEEVWYECEFCNDLFPDEPTLDEHIKDQHPLNPVKNVQASLPVIQSPGQQLFNGVTQKQKNSVVTLLNNGTPRKNVITFVTKGQQPPAQTKENVVTLLTNGTNGTPQRKQMITFVNNPTSPVNLNSQHSPQGTNVLNVLNNALHPQTTGDIKVFYQCQHCQTLFTEKSLLENHIKTEHTVPTHHKSEEQYLVLGGHDDEHHHTNGVDHHNNETPVSANDPNLSGTSLELLTDPMKVEHPLDPPVDPPPNDAVLYQCAICEETFPTQDDTEIHMASDHAEICADCGFTCVGEEALFDHRRKVHPTAIKSA